MGHVVTKPREPFDTASGALRIHQIPSMMDNLIWLIVDPASKRAAAVDGPEAGVVLEHCEKHGFELTTIVNTHTHYDHVGINHDLAERKKLADTRVIGPKRAAKDVPGLTDPVDDGDTVELFGQTARVMLTEGHIDGHVSYLIDGVLFCGDTLFGAGCGYLFDGPPAKMHDSLSRLAALPEDTLVCCAHEYTQDNLRFAWSVEPDNDALAERIRRDWALRADGGCTIPTTIGVERETNPFLRTHSATIRSKVGVDGEDGAAIFAATRALKDGKAYKSIGDETLPL